MTKEKIKYLVLSDIHLGHSRNKTKNIIRNLNSFLIDYKQELKNLDILFISGDTFDRLLTTKSEEYIESLKWLSNLLLYCKERKIKLRILEGTPSHDARQIEAFVEVAKELDKNVDFKYINKLDIEYIQDLNINVLYVPDEWRHDSEITLKEVKDLLKEKHLAQVDISIMHGCFRYQLPIKPDAKFLHKESEYLDITKYYINIGHVHTGSAYERILAPGSFDRLSHGEEENKGGLLCNIYKDGSMDFKFLINNFALIFNTIEYTNEDEKEIIKDLKNKLKKYPDGSFIRIKIKNDNKLMKSLKSFLDVYINLNIKIEIDEKIIKKVSIDELLKKDNKTFEINKSNIEKLVNDCIDNSDEEDEWKEYAKLIAKDFY